MVAQAARNAVLDGVAQTVCGGLRGAITSIESASVGTANWTVTDTRLGLPSG